MFIFSSKRVPRAICEPKACTIQTVEITSSASMPLSATCWRDCLHLVKLGREWKERQIRIPLCILRNKLVHQSPSYNQTQKDRGHRKSKLPTSHISNGETNEKTTNGGDNDGDFLQDRLLDKVYLVWVQIKSHKQSWLTGVWLDTCCDFACSNFVKIRNILPKDSLKVHFLVYRS